MKKLFLSLVAMLFCSATVFAQTSIPLTQDNFVSAIKANPSGDFILTENIHLGDTITTSIISTTFSGTLDGDGFTISYVATASAASPFGLFQTVSGTIENLNINASMTLSVVDVGGSAAETPVGLLCGELNGGTIQNCNAVNCMINSMIQASNGKGICTGLLVGSMTNATLAYCTASGNVTSNGSVGGLVGAALETNTIKACYFSGSVSGILEPDGTQMADAVGGICGEASSATNISFCCVDATIDGQANECGIVCGTPKNGNNGFQHTGTSATPSVGNVYAGGTVNGDVINSSSEVTNSGNQSLTGLYYEHYNNMTAQQIVDALNADIPTEEQGEFYFDVIDGHVVLVIGERVCNTPSNLRVTPHSASVDLAWDAPAGATRFEVVITGGHMITEEGAIIKQVNGTTCTVTGVGVSATPYQVTVRTQCGDNFYSDGISTAFNSTCPNINGLTVNNITHETATATWTSTESTTFTVRLFEGNDINSTPIYTTTTESQAQASINLSSLEEATQYTLEVVASCNTNVNVDANHSILTFTTKRLNFETQQSGDFHLASTWRGGEVPQGTTANIKINEGHIVTLHRILGITDDYKIIENKGVLVVYQDAQLINTSTTNVPGIVEIVALNNELTGIWYFMGAPFENNYNLGTILPVTGSDIAVSKYDYTEADWSDSWADVYTTMSAGEGYFAWPFYNGSTVFTTYGDVCTWDNENERWERNNYDFNRPTTATKLNNDNVTITKDVQSVNGGRWMALTNPYPAKLNVSLFVVGNDIVSETQGEIQGKGIYRLVNIAMGDNNQSFLFEPNGEIAMCEGFFVNLASGNSVTFTKNQLTNYPSNPVIPNKSQVAPREFVELSLVKGNHNSKLYFAHNQEAEQNYDIFDANKLFALGEVAEPYFVTDGIALVKEEAKELPYYATMNVRSFANDTVSFVVNNIPEGLAVSIIDGENIIDMVEGGVYTTEILTGENADRFKVLIKKSLSISDAEELDVNIYNDNRHINIETLENDLQVEVYNALGQKVLSTKDRNFTLNQVSAGAYLIKAFNNKASKTQKILVK